MELSCPVGRAFSIVAPSGGIVTVNPESADTEQTPSDFDAITLYTRELDVPRYSKLSSHVLSRPGEYEVGSVSIYGIAVGDGSSSSGAGKFDVVYVINDGQTSLGVFAGLSSVPNKSVLEKMGTVDALAVDISGSTLEPDALASVIRNLDVEAVIIRADEEMQGTLEKITKELGSQEVATEKKFKLSARNAPQGKLNVVALQVV